jgi:hypothetical protein
MLSKTLDSLIEVLADVTMNPFVKRFIAQEFISSLSFDHFLRSNGPVQTQMQSHNLEVDNIHH